MTSSTVDRSVHLSPVPLLALPEPILGMPRSGMITEIPTPPEWRRDLADYMAWQRAAGRPETTVKIRGYHLRRFATAASCAPYEVTLDVLVDHLGCGRWSAHTRRSVRSSLRSFYNWAHVTGRASQNPAGLLPPVSTPPGRPRPAPLAAVERGMVNLDQRVTLMVQLGDQVGMRCCEIAVVHTSDVVGVRGLRSIVVHGKGNKDRQVPISEALAQQLLGRDPGWVFPGLIDGHLSAGYVSKLISRAMAGLATGHQLRHKFASEALRRAGGNLRVVQELLGHSSVATTQIYTAVDDDELRRAAFAA